MAKDN
ncbi:hypothetical protein EC951288_4609A, partial [Escherichia coli 95.1288]